MGGITNRLLNNRYLLHSFRRDNKKSGSTFSTMHLLGVLLFSGFCVFNFNRFVQYIFMSINFVFLRKNSRTHLFCRQPDYQFDI